MQEFTTEEKLSCLEIIDFNSLKKTSYVLDSEVWEDDLGSLLTVNVWESRKHYMVKMHVLAPSLTPRGGILVRMESCGMVGMTGVVS